MLTHGCQCCHPQGAPRKTFSANAALQPCGGKSQAYLVSSICFSTHLAKELPPGSFSKRNLLRSTTARWLLGLWARHLTPHRYKRASGVNSPPFQRCVVPLLFASVSLLTQELQARKERASLAVVVDKFAVEEGKGPWEDDITTNVAQVNSLFEAMGVKGDQRVTLQNDAVSKDALLGALEHAALTTKVLYVYISTHGAMEADGRGGHLRSLSMHPVGEEVAVEEVLRTLRFLPAHVCLVVDSCEVQGHQLPGTSQVGVVQLPDNDRGYERLSLVTGSYAFQSAVGDRLVSALHKFMVEKVPNEEYTRARQLADDLEADAQHHWGVTWPQSLCNGDGSLRFNEHSDAATVQAALEKAMQDIGAMPKAERENYHATFVALDEWRQQYKLAAAAMGVRLPAASHSTHTNRHVRSGLTECPCVCRKVH